LPARSLPWLATAGGKGHTIRGEEGGGITVAWVMLNFEPGLIDLEGGQMLR